MQIQALGIFLPSTETATVQDTTITSVYYCNIWSGTGGWPSVYNARQFSCMNKVAFSRFQATLAYGSTTLLSVHFCNI
jgi:hypothetical protein